MAAEDHDFVDVTEEEVTCKLCKKHYSSPQLVDCLHTFCKDCIEQNIRKEDQHFIFICPKCLHITKRKEEFVKSLTPNHYVLSLLEVFRCHTPALSSCTVCSLGGNFAMSTHVCLSCGDKLCQDCSKKHTFSSLTANHKVATKSDLQRGKYDQHILKKCVLFCVQHPRDECSIFCHTCSQPKCVKCVVTNHKDHRYSSLEAAAETTKTVLLSKLKNVQEPSSETMASSAAKEELDALQREEDAFVKTVTENTELMIESIKKQSEEILKDGMKRFSEERTRRQLKMDMLLRKSERRENILWLCRTLTAQGRCEIAAMVDALKKGLDLLHDDKPLLDSKEPLTTYKLSIPSPSDYRYFKILKEDVKPVAQAPVGPSKAPAFASEAVKLDSISQQNASTTTETKQSKLEKERKAFG